MPPLFDIYFENARARGDGEGPGDFDDYGGTPCQTLWNGSRQDTARLGRPPGVVFGRPKTPQKVAGEDVKAPENEDVSA